MLRSGSKYVLWATLAVAFVIVFAVVRGSARASVPGPVPAPQDDSFRVNYFDEVNDPLGNARVRILNPTTAGLCAMIYVIDTNAVMQACCGCFMPPSSNLELSIPANLLGNTVDLPPPEEGDIRIISSNGIPTPTTCNAGEMTAAKNTLRSWATRQQDVLGSDTESEFTQVPLSSSEQATLQKACLHIQNFDATAGICDCTPDHP